MLAPPILHQAKQQVNVFSLIPLFSNSFNHSIVSPLLDAPKSIYLFMGYLDFSTVLTWVEGKWVKSNNVRTFSKLPFTSNNFEPLLFDNSTSELVGKSILYSLLSQNQVVLNDIALDLKLLNPIGFYYCLGMDLDSNFIFVDCRSSPFRIFSALAFLAFVSLPFFGRREPVLETKAPLEFLWVLTLSLFFGLLPWYYITFSLSSFIIHGNRLSTFNSARDVP